jgi:ATP-dependent Lon protease
MATAVISAFTNRPVRRDVAMTGEVTLRGKVLAIGGLKSKTIAAHRAGIKMVIMPKDNAKDIPELPERVRQDLILVPVSHLGQVLELALVEGTEPPFAVEMNAEKMGTAVNLPPVSVVNGGAIHAADK